MPGQNDPVGIEDLSDSDELWDFCEEVWSDDVDPELLVSLAQSNYGFGDFGWGEEDDDRFPDLFTWQYADIYSVLGEDRGGDFGRGFPLFRVLAGAHPRTPRHVLRQLTSDKDPEVLWAVAANPSADDEILVSIINRNEVLSDGIRELADPRLDDGRDTGICYGTDQAWELTDVPVDTAVAGSRSCGPELLDWFSRTSSVDLAKALILRNGDRLTEDQWRLLIEGTRGRDRWTELRGWLQWIADSPHLPLTLIGDVLPDREEGPILARRLVRTTSTPDWVLQLLLDHGVDEWTRSRIAAHSSVTSDMLQVLAVDPSAKVRAAVITSSAATDEIRALAALGP